MLFQKIRKPFFHPDASILDQDNNLKIITVLYAFSGYLLVVWSLIILQIYQQTSVLYFLVVQGEQPPEEFLKAAVAFSCKLFSVPNSGLTGRTAVLRKVQKVTGVAQEHSLEFRTRFPQVRHVCIKLHIRVLCVFCEMWGYLQGWGQMHKDDKGCKWMGFSLSGLSSSRT